MSGFVLQKTLSDASRNQIASSATLDTEIDSCEGTDVLVVHMY